MLLSASQRTRNLLSFSYVSFFAMWFIACVFIMLSTTGNGSEFFMTGKDRPARCDFVFFYEAGKIACSEDRSKSYDLDVQSRWLNKVSYPIIFRDPPFIDYVPVVFTMMIPFALLPIKLAFICWTVFTLGSGIFGMIMLARTNSISGKQLFSLIAVVLGSEPSFLAMRHGQSTHLLLGAFCLFYWGLCKSKNLLAGFGAAISTIKPQYVALWLIPIVARRHWLLLSTVIAMGLMLLSIAGLNLGFETVLNYPSFLLHIEHSSADTGVARSQPWLLYEES